MAAKLLAETAQEQIIARLKSINLPEPLARALLDPDFAAELPDELLLRWYAVETLLDERLATAQARRMLTGDHHGEDPVWSLVDTSATNAAINAMRAAEALRNRAVRVFVELRNAAAARPVTSEQAPAQDDEELSERERELLDRHGDVE